MLNTLLKSVIEQDRSPIVICNLEHKIVYMNKSAVKHYGKYGGEKLLGESVFDCHNKDSCTVIKKVISWFAESRENNMIFTARSVKENSDIYMVALRNEEGMLIGYYEKHESRRYEENSTYDFSKSLL